MELPLKEYYDPPSRRPTKKVSRSDGYAKELSLHPLLNMTCLRADKAIIQCTFTTHGPTKTAIINISKKTV